MKLSIRKLLVLLLLLVLAGELVFANGNGNLGQSVNIKKTGLNYVSATRRLGQRFVPAGAPQPASFVISGIPAGATIEKGYIWLSTSGNGAPITATVQNPAAATANFPMIVVGSGADKCWGYAGSHTYRVDVTSAISGNGTYLISGLPTGSPNDVDGATLMVVFSNSAATFEGHIIIHDGSVVVNGGSASQTLTGITAAVNASLANAFVGIGDIQISANTLSITGATTSNIVWDWWNFEVRSTVVNAGQTTANFSFSSSGDCYNWSVMGLYYQTPAPRSITTSVTNTSLCPGQAIDVDYTTTGSFGADNTFTAELSDASGSFASPTAIGSVAAITSGTINATIPANTPSGSGYRIRVVADDPASTGTDNGANITIGTLPAVTCPANITVNNDPDQCGAVVNFAATGTGNITYLPASGSVFPIGTTTVTATAATECGTITCTFTVTVLDAQAPAITNISVNPTSLWPPNHTMRDVTVSYTATDNCGVSTSLSVTSNEPINGLGDGDVAPDWNVVNNNQVQLRAERSGTGTGRIYTIAITAMDAAGNTSTQNVTVTVPKAQNNAGITGRDVSGLEMREGLTVQTINNPSVNQFTLITQSRNNGPITVRILDAFGKVVESRMNITANGVLQLGSNFRPGVYFAEVMQGREKVSVKLIKK